MVDIKRVLYVLEAFPKLSETFILNEVVELVNRGVDVNILASKNPMEKKINEEVSNYGLLEKTRYLNTLSSISLKCCLSTSFFKNVLGMIKGNHAGMRLRERMGQSYYAALYKNVDIIHAHFAYNAAVGAMLLSRTIGKPFTFTAHAFEIFRHPFYSRERLKMLVDNAAAVITPSEYNKRHIVMETGCNEDKVKIVRATINPERFKKDPADREEKGIKILAAGRLVEKKGFEYLIKAMGIVVRKDPSVSLNIIGGGELEKDLVGLAETLGLTGNVNFLGEQPNERCIDELSSSALAVLPCIIARNGDVDVCPLTLQEAMAMEVPVISTTAGSVPELVDDGINGLLVQKKDEAALADAIIRLAEDPALRREMGRKGREKILREFNIGTQVNRLLKVWGELGG